MKLKRFIYTIIDIKGVHKHILHAHDFVDASRMASKVISLFPSAYETELIETGEIINID